MDETLKRKKGKYLATLLGSLPMLFVCGHMFLFQMQMKGNTDAGRGIIGYIILLVPVVLIANFIWLLVLVKSVFDNDRVMFIMSLVVFLSFLFAILGFLFSFLLVMPALMWLIVLHVIAVVTGTGLSVVFLVIPKKGMSQNN